MAARAAENGGRVEFILRPNFWRMAGEFDVTRVAREPLPAALESDRNDVALAVVMSTARLFIHLQAIDLDVVDLHVSDLRHARTRA